MNRSKQAIPFFSIGKVLNEFDENSSREAMKSGQSQLVIDPDLAQGLAGLEAGEDLLVLYYFDRSEGYDLLQHPRGDRSRPRRGVFALRTPRRPNPIAVSEVKILSIKENVLTVQGLDAYNNSPILDLKPA